MPEWIQVPDNRLIEYLLDGRAETFPPWDFSHNKCITSPENFIRSFEHLYRIRNMLNYSPEGNNVKILKALVFFNEITID